VASSQRLLARVLVWIRSLRLAAVLLTLITLAAVVGGIVPQAPITPNAEEIYRAYGPFWQRLITRLALDDVFHSWWFLSLLGLFAVNLLTCTAMRVRGSLRTAFGSPNYVPVEQQGALAIEITQAHGDTEDRVARALGRIGFRRTVRLSDPLSGRVQLLARRFRLGVLGADLVHLGVLVILVGGLLGALRQEGTFRLHEWEKGLRIPSCEAIQDGSCVPLPFDVQIDDFGVEIYPESGRTKMFWAELSFWNGNELLDRGRTEINRPFTLNGVGFYPWRYGQDPTAAEVRLHIVETEREVVVSEAILRIGETVDLPDGDLRVTALRFFRTFALDDQGQAVDLGSVSGGHSAVLLEVGLVGGGEPGYRDIALPFLPETGTKPAYSFLLADAHIPASMQIHFVRSPGYRVVWTGFLLVMIGLAGALYFAPTFIRVAIEDGRILLRAESRRARARLPDLVAELAGDIADQNQLDLDEPQEV